MLYSRPEYAALLLLTAAAYLACSRRSARLALLIAASLAFYAWASYFDTVIFLSVVAVSWAATRLAEADPRRRTLYLAAGIAAMAAHLLFWKYAPWLCKTAQKVVPSLLDGRLVLLPLPAGISFFTLQGIAYLVDIGRGRARASPLPDYVLFKSFFPQLIAGPIVRWSELMPQIAALRRPDWRDAEAGLKLFAFGLFKKLVLADRLAPFADSAFLEPGAYDRGALALAVACYTVQIWADFSGYTDMGRGSARLLGFKLPENFLSPYLAASPSEFWRRWHVTLSEWIRDYIYIPLGGGRGGPARAFGVLMLTMGVSGLWHGAAWNFLLWGLYHGGLLAAQRALERARPSAWTSLPAAARTALARAATLACVMFGWLLFRAIGLAGLRAYLGAFAAGTGSRVPSIGPWEAGLCLLACAALHALQHRPLGADAEDERWSFLSARPALSGCALAAAVCAILYLRAESSKAFIYFQF